MTDAFLCLWLPFGNAVLLASHMSCGNTASAAATSDSSWDRWIGPTRQASWPQPAHWYWLWMRKAGLQAPLCPCARQVPLGCLRDFGWNGHHDAQKQAKRKDFEVYRFPNMLMTKFGLSTAVPDRLHMYRPACVCGCASPYVFDCESMCADLRAWLRAGGTWAFFVYILG